MNARAWLGPRQATANALQRRWLGAGVFGDFRDQAGRIAEENRLRSPVLSSVRVSRFGPHHDRRRYTADLRERGPRSDAVEVVFGSGYR